MGGPVVQPHHLQHRCCCPLSVQQRCPHGPRRSPCCCRHPLRIHPRLQRRYLHQQCWPEGCLLNPVETPPSRQQYLHQQRSQLFHHVWVEGHPPSDAPEALQQNLPRLQC